MQFFWQVNKWYVCFKITIVLRTTSSCCHDGSCWASPNFFASRQRAFDNGPSCCAPNQSRQYFRMALEAHKCMANGLNAAVFSSVKSILSDSNRDRPRDRQIGSIASNGIDKKKIQRK